MKWNEVKIETASEAVEAVANILMELGQVASLLKIPLILKTLKVINTVRY